MSQIDRKITCPHCGKSFDKTFEVDIDEIDYTGEKEDFSSDLD